MTSGNQKAKITRGGHIATGTSAQRRAKTAKYGRKKSAATRRKLVDAARSVFISVGYFEARVSDIVAEANVAHGSFYTYFPSKREAFLAVAEEIRDLITEAVQPGNDDIPGDTLGNLERANRRYLRLHAEHSRLLDLLEQVATEDIEVQKSRVASRAVHVKRVRRMITTLQERGQADTDIDVEITAGALVSMLSSYAHWSTLAPEYDEDRVIAVLTKIWVRAIGLRPKPVRERD